MFLVLVSLVAVAAAAPQNSLQVIDHGSVPSQDQTPSGSCSESDADTGYLGEVVENFTRKEYILTMQVCGYEKKDIEVNVKKGLLTVQAVQNRNKHISYTKALPENVDPTSGKWLYDNDVLKIVFRLIKEKPSWSDVPSTMKQAVVAKHVVEYNTSGDGYTPIVNE